MLEQGFYELGHFDFGVSDVFAGNLQQDREAGALVGTPEPGRPASARGFPGAAGSVLIKASMRWVLLLCTFYRCGTEAQGGVLEIPKTRPCFHSALTPGWTHASDAQLGSHEAPSVSPGLTEVCAGLGLGDFTLAESL